MSKILVQCTCDKEKLAQDRIHSRKVCLKFNKKRSLKKQHKIIRKHLKHLGENSKIMQGFNCDYGYNISIGNNSFINYNCVILDSSPVNIGNFVRIAPNVSIFSTYHPTTPQTRKDDVILSEPITILDNAWIGGGSVILAGVTIGENSVVGANSVVTKDVPDNVVVAGSPAKIIKQLEKGENK